MQTPSGIADLTLLNRVLANRAIAKLDSAIAQVATQHARLGALENRLEHGIANQSVSLENLNQAETRICDADIAQEFIKYVRKKLLMEIGYALLAQANLLHGSVLKLVE